MAFNLESTVLCIGIVITGLTAGLCFTWTNAVTPGIGQLNDLEFLKAFQQMNRAIINPLFIMVFFGPFITHLFTVYLKYQRGDTALWIYVAAAVLFILGVVLVTIAKNVPLNEILDQMDLEETSDKALYAFRQKFERPWRQWHGVRTFSATASFILMILGLLLHK